MSVSNPGRGRGMDWGALARRIREVETEEEAIKLLIDRVAWYTKPFEEDNE